MNNDFREKEALKSAILKGEISGYQTPEASPLPQLPIVDVSYICGDLLDAKVDVIAHQTNCKGVMGAGIAKQIRDKYPEIFPKYQAACKAENMLGKCQLLQTYSGVVVANLFGQYGFGKRQLKADGSVIPYTDYEALASAIRSLVQQMKENGFCSVAFPYLIGSHLAGGDWDTIEPLIMTAFKSTDFQVSFYSISPYPISITPSKNKANPDEDDLPF